MAKHWIQDATAKMKAKGTIWEVRSGKAIFAKTPQQVRLGRRQVKRK